MCFQKPCDCLVPLVSDKACLSTPVVNSYCMMGSWIGIDQDEMRKEIEGVGVILSGEEVKNILIT